MSSQPTDYYELLEISRSATQDEIKQSFRKQARRWHPDKSSSPLARSRFAAVYEAYSILSNPWKRRVYDGKLSASLGRRERGEYEEWRKDARRRAARYADESYEDFWREIQPDLRAIFLGQPPPGIYESVGILLKMFVLTACLVLVFQIFPAYLASDQLVATLLESGLDAPSTVHAIAAMKEYALLISLLLFGFVAGVLLMLASAVSVDGEGAVVSVLRALFCHDDRVTPMFYTASSLLISAYIWLIALGL